MRIDVLTLFPEMFEGPMTASMMWKARDRGLLELHLHDIRDHTTDKHRTADDIPYGGGGGMLMKVDVLANTIEAVKTQPETPVIFMSPQGRLLSHQVAAELAQHERLIILCGHYEGIDERVLDLFVTDEISIGDYVLTGGELAAMVVIDALTRHIPGVLGAEGAHERDSHADGLLEGPHYTRPQVFRGMEVPRILQNGNHHDIERWRRRQALRRTWRNRPDLLLTASLEEEDKYFLATFADEETMRR
ncbi:MAG TPA: tRNA (guanosine(37)-N1)-methyltransferase TrmD [Phototrophicaceae bacterium]|jgi:tRNA (guanine37-N1)-methyltransferase|nr:tRNA (guanosine(37)-N1)-methyltransferase TrmD [Phototrophicaceae bacterium]